MKIANGLNENLIVVNWRAEFNIQRKIILLLFSFGILSNLKGIAQENPEVVAPGVISTGNDYCTTLSPDGKTLYFARTRPNGGDDILMSKFVDGKWYKPELVSFSGTFSDTDPLLSVDGTKMFFMTNRNLNQDGWEDDYDIWVTEKEGEIWGEPYRLPDYINSSFYEGFPSTSSNGNLYFFRANKAGHSEQDIWFSIKVGGGYDQPFKISSDINSEAWDGHPFISPDEKFMIFYSSRDGGNGRCDLYISFKNSEGWSASKNLGSRINTADCEMVPFVSRDMKTLYFSRIDKDGGRNIYQVSFQLVLDELKSSMKNN